MELSNFAITIPCPAPGICTENLLRLLGYCILIFAGGLFGVDSEGRAFVCKRFLPFLEFVIARIDDRQQFGLIFVALKL